MRYYNVYAAIPGKERVFFNTYTSDQEHRAINDIKALKAIGLRVEIESEEDPK